MAGTPRTRLQGAADRGGSAALAHVVSKTLQDHLLSVEMSTLISDLMQFGESIHEELEESIRAFEEEASYRRPA